MSLTHPEIAAEWHPSRNGETTPRDVSGGSHKKVWWLGKCGHEWFAQVGSRTQNRTGCPVCSGRQLLVGFNDLATTHPELSDEWHPTKNGGLNPEAIGRGARRKAWWICTNGHEWEAIIANRVWGNGCPYCTHQWVLKGENDLLTLEPELARQWHPTMNGDVTPDQVFSTTGKKYWWICDTGHEWDAKVSNRKSFGLGCPICSNQRLMVGFNDLGTTHPTLAAEWHPTRNSAVVPSQIFANTKVKPWWLGKCGHEWQADVGSRARGNGCPFCSNKKVLQGFNDLATTHPQLAAEWHPTKNGSLAPESVTAGTNKKIWWFGNCGHAWESIGHSRAVRESGCPICRNLQLEIGFNDLATVGERILGEWHEVKNRGIDPARVIGSSAIKYWWRCENGHEWTASSAARLRGTGCPSCSVRGFSTASPGYFYFIENRELQARKVGIANQTSSRLNDWLSQGWQLLHEIRSDDGLHILNLETMTLNWIRNDLGLQVFLGKEETGRLGGWSETFSEDGVSGEKIIEKVQEFDLFLSGLD